MKIIHIISGLNNGGAEMMLLKLLKNIEKNDYKIEIISLMDEGLLGPEIKKLGIKVHALKMKRGKPSLKSLFKARKICKDADVIQSWMYHADLFSFIVGKIILNKKVIWGIHHSNLEKNKNKITTLLIAKINSYFSKYIDEIISCSIKAKEVHVKFGYKIEKITVIPNGFELEEYYLKKESRKKIEKELKIDSNKIILSIVGRWDKLKDHKNALNALTLLKKKHKNLVMILAGTKMEENNKELKTMLKEKKLEKDIFLIGRRNDIPDVMSATDIYVSSSSGEGFPNVIGEAMACETPCVVTNVGDSAYIVGKNGIIVPRENSNALAEGIENLLSKSIEERKKIGLLSRKRIIENFEIKRVVKMYCKLY